MNWKEKIKKKLENDQIVVGIVGLGYVGLPLAVAFSKKYKTIGYDVDKKKIWSLRKGRSYIEDVSNTEILNENFLPTSAPYKLKACDFILITVPTPLREEKLPDLSYIKASAKTVGKLLHKGQFVILESTTYPGTTEEVLVPILEEVSGLRAVEDFGVAYSPERIDPGNRKYKLQDIPKVVGGITPECTEIAVKLYKKVVKKVVPVKNCKTAEAVKMLENIFRYVNIALVNELAILFEKIGINVWEVIEAAKTKPYGFMPFFPSPGVGGHCIPLDPYYLSYKAKRVGIVLKFIETAREINEYMPIHTVNLVEKGLRKYKGKEIRKARILVLGLSYKANIADTRESPAIKIIEELIERGVKVKVFDPHVSKINTKYGTFSSEKNLEKVLQWAECILILVDHEEFKCNLPALLSKLKGEKIIIDTKNVLYKMRRVGRKNIIILGCGKESDS